MVGILERSLVQIRDTKGWYGENEPEESGKDVLITSINYMVILSITIPVR